VSELTIKLENLQATLTDPVRDEDIRVAWSMVDEVIGEVRQLEARIDRYETALKHIVNHGGGYPETLVSVMGHAAKVALGGEIIECTSVASSDGPER